MKRRGFTLVELLAVIAVLAILVIIALPNIIEMFNSAKKKSFHNELRILYSVAEQTYVKDKFNTSGLSAYARSEDNIACTKQLDMTGRGNIFYYMEIDGEGKVKRIYAKDSSFQYSLEKDDLKKSDIKLEDIELTSDADDKFSITCSGKRSIIHNSLIANHNIVITFHNTLDNSTLTQTINEGDSVSKIGYNSNGNLIYPMSGHAKFSNWQVDYKKIIGWSTSDVSTEKEYEVYDNIPSSWLSEDSIDLYTVWDEYAAFVYMSTNGGVIDEHTYITQNPWGSYQIGDENKWKTEDTEVNSQTYNVIYKSYKPVGSSSFGEYKPPQIRFKCLEYTGSRGLADPDNSQLINITRSGYHIKPTEEWICLSGNCKQSAYDKGTGYNGCDFCDIKENDCDIVVGVNWVAN